MPGSLLLFILLYLFLLRAELVDGCRQILFAWAEGCAGPFGMVGAVGIVLCLEAEGAAARILHALLADEAAVEEVACIELNAGLVGEHLHEDAGVRVIQCAEALVDADVAVTGEVLDVEGTPFDFRTATAIGHAAQHNLKIK